jgi:hypothetical protein
MANLQLVGNIAGAQNARITLTLRYVTDYRDEQGRVPPPVMLFEKLPGAEWTAQPGGGPAIVYGPAHAWLTAPRVEISYTVLQPGLPPLAKTIARFITPNTDPAGYWDWTRQETGGTGTPDSPPTPINVLPGTGPQGERGPGLLQGLGPPAAALGRPGDSYVNQNTWDIYLKAGTWVLTGNIRGGTGGIGPKGDPGVDGKSFPVPTAQQIGFIPVADGSQPSGFSWSNQSALRLARLGDVAVTGITDGQTLMWDAAARKFVPGTPAGSSLDPEAVQDLVAAMLIQGAGIGITYDDETGRVTISVPGSGGAVAWGDITGKPVSFPPSAHQHVSTNINDFKAAVAALFAQGTGVTLSTDPATGITTISATGGAGGGLDAEQVQDLVAEMLVQGSGVTLAYDDVTGKLTISAIGGGGTSTIQRPLTAWVEIGGSDSTGAIGDAGLPYATINAALEAGAALGGALVIRLGMGSFAPITQAKLDNAALTHISIIGVRRPVVDSVTAPTTLIGGSIIKGPFMALRDHLQVEGLGVDSGSAVCAALYGGSPQEGLLLAVPAVADPGQPLRPGLRAVNVVGLCSSPGAAVHAFACVNGSEPHLDNIETWYGVHGMAFKSQGGYVGRVNGHGHGQDTAIFKTDGYSHCEGVVAGPIECHAVGAAGRGVILEASGGGQVTNDLTVTILNFTAQPAVVFAGGGTLRNIRANVLNIGGGSLSAGSVGTLTNVIVTDVMAPPATGGGGGTGGPALFGRATANSPQAIPGGGTWVQIDLPIVTSAAGGAMVANQFTCPAAGTYSVKGSAAFYTLTAGQQYGLGIRVNGRPKVTDSSSAAGSVQTVFIGGDFECNAGDIITLWAKNASAAAIYEDGSDDYTVLSVLKL